MNYNYMHLTISHAEGMFRIESESFSDPWTKESIISSLENPLNLTVGSFDSTGELCGFVCATVIPPEAEILNIAVLGSHRQKGIGQALLNSMLSELKNDFSVDTVFLEVRESNIPARSLYTKFGFEVIGARSRYYSNPTEDAILMAKNLDNYLI